MRYLLLFILFIAVDSGLEAQALRPISYYLSHPRVSKAAKQFHKKLPLYQQNERAYYDDPAVEGLSSSILDSLMTRNAQTRPFYFYLANRNLVMTDGSLLMTSIYAQYSVIREQPAYFFRFMLDNPAEKKNYFDKWASTMLGFADQYCPGILQREMDTCLFSLKEDVLKKLEGEKAAIIGLAQAFFVLLQVPAGQP